MATVKTILEPKDVPGVMLRDGIDFEDHSKLELRRWLEYHVSNSISAGRADHISLAVDGGKWYDAKREMLEIIIYECGDAKYEIFQISFCTCPNYFNKGHIYTYIAGTQCNTEDYVANNDAGPTEKPF
ncbi:hypothetical protein FQR65_LT13661 [Abscondita terminalis]|nr:hypothetical protein FQR65_LT13661 [Abscondita terminalis]